jgi:hypothetical protein
MGREKRVVVRTDQRTFLLDGGFSLAQVDYPAPYSRPDDHAASTPPLPPSRQAPWTNAIASGCVPDNLSATEPSMSV